ncbi:MAG: PilN domain-containing protein [Bdellovibrionales bacterium]|nr:PilN domain-containing protein [Bdellovibrionales bacterium]
MIRINLLGYNPKEEAAKMLAVAGFVASLVLCVVLWVGLMFMASSTKEKLEEKRSDLQLEFTQLNKKTKSVKDLEGKRKLLRDKLSLIARLKKSKIGPVRMLDDLNVAVPAGVWIRSIDEKGGTMRIQGRALTPDDISVFMKELEKSEYFSNVELLESLLMYYSKKTGNVSALPEKNLEGITKESATGDEGPKVRVQVQGVQETHIKIQQFLMEVNVRYAGTLKTDPNGDRQKRDDDEEEE